MESLPLEEAHCNLCQAALYEHALQNREGILAFGGPLVVQTGKYTGRSPYDKFVVQEESSSDRIWWGEVNRPFSQESFERLYEKMLHHLGRRPFYVQDCCAGADPEHRIPLRVITEQAWHSLFAKHLFINPVSGSRKPATEPEFTVLHAPGCKADPGTDGTRSEAFVLLHFGRGLILIGGTSYAGEIKKAVFTALNYYYPLRSVLSMHCSVNEGQEGDTAVFFGLSGTGKTTLSTVQDRKLIGDDEHGWDDKGLFNFEGGCYAKVIRLSAEAEPEIFGCTRAFGTVLENVAVDPWTRRLDLDDDSLTENTRAGYPLSFIPNSVEQGQGRHPSHIFMLTADAFGILPPVAKLSTAQAMYHFLSGYTAKLAGTERGIQEPQATFSTCFGSPFLPLPPSLYAELLGRKMEEHKTSCWLINTGWSGGPFGEGRRIDIDHTRSLIRAALNGQLEEVAYEVEPLFGLSIPASCPGVPREILRPRDTWRDPAAYDEKGRELARLFKENFASFAGEVEPRVLQAGPRS
jgi:phosphoenolpyruvate carboxykinase (ATP)